MQLWMLLEMISILFTAVDIIGVDNGEDTITISWVDHPFTTSITYCVDVIQILGSTETSQLDSTECGLTETLYSFTPPGHGPCDRFNFTVIATDGVNKTSSQPVTGYFTQARGKSLFVSSITSMVYTLAYKWPVC